MSAADTSEASHPRLRWPQYSLRSLMLLVAGCAALLGFYVSGMWDYVFGLLLCLGSFAAGFIMGRQQDRLGRTEFIRRLVLVFLAIDLAVLLSMSLILRWPLVTAILPCALFLSVSLGGLVGAPKKVGGVRRRPVVDGLVWALAVGLAACLMSWTGLQSWQRCVEREDTQRQEHLHQQLRVWVFPAEPIGLYAGPLHLFDRQGIAVRDYQLRLGGPDLATVGRMTNVCELSLHSRNITDSGLGHLKGLPHLRKLNLQGTRITDAGLVHLETLPRLTELILQNTSVTDEGIKKLKERLPDVVILK